MLETPSDVEHALWRYTDPTQPASASVTVIPSSGSTGSRGAFERNVLEGLDERQELAARMAWLEPEERAVLVRWYVEGAKPDTIARGIRRSVRHVYRVRGRALHRIIDLGDTAEFSDVDVAEFA
jgi:DNA-directed RNA polymerase specialized sigma24 family protein